MMVIREEGCCVYKQVVVEGCGVVGGDLVGWLLMVVDVHMLQFLFVLI